ncbi:glycosyltransferase family 4 protein [bacterium]|nr:glycosyltransferase family 4 protein [bacterium]
MHILFITENYPPEVNAVASRVSERAAYWLRWGHKVTVITSVPNFPRGKIYKGYRNLPYQVEYIDGVRVVRVITFIARNKGVIRRLLDFNSLMISAFLASLIQKTPDIVVATSPQFFAAVAGWLIAVRFRRPFVFELSDLWPASVVAVGAMRPSFGMRMIEKLELHLYRRAMAVIALTKSFKNDLVARGIPSKKIVVVQNGVELSMFKPQLKNQELNKQLGLVNKFVLGYIGTHGMAHDLLNVVKAAEILKPEDDIRFLFVGDGAERDMLAEEVKKRKLKNVIMVLTQPKDTIPDYWSLCDVSLVHLKDSPTFKTVIPSKIFEAMGMGLPILLVAPKGEASNIIETDKVGVWIPAADPEVLARTVIDIKMDESLMNKWKKNSLNSAKLHTREIQAQKMIDVLDAVVEHKEV